MSDKEEACLGELSQASVLQSGECENKENTF